MQIENECGIERIAEHCEQEEVQSCQDVERYSVQRSRMELFVFVPSARNTHQRYEGCDQQDERQDTEEVYDVFQRIDPVEHIVNEEVQLPFSAVERGVCDVVLCVVVVREMRMVDVGDVAFSVPQDTVDKGMFPVRHPVCPFALRDDLPFRIQDLTDQSVIFQRNDAIRISACSCPYIVVQIVMQSVGNKLFIDLFLVLSIEIVSDHECSGQDGSHQDAYGKETDQKGCRLSCNGSEKSLHLLLPPSMMYP